MSLPPIPPVLFEDNHLLAVNKPAGLLVQGDETGDPCLADVMKVYIAEKYNKPGAVFLGVIHRIDRPVSGLVLMARTSKALARMNEQFRLRQVEKTYLAVVEGNAPNEATLVHWLRKNSTLNKTTVFSKETVDAARCELSFRRLASDGKYALLEVNPLTGRPHQIRAQLSAVGHPIVGDTKYGSSDTLTDRSIGLHSRRLEFEHPVLRQPISITAPVPRQHVWLAFQVHVP